MVNKTARTHKETIETVLGVQLLNLVKEARDHVVAARSLTAAEDNAYVHGLVSFCFCGNKLYERHSVCVREELLDLLLVVNALCGSAFLDCYSTLKSLGQLRLISGSFFLQCTFFHKNKCKTLLLLF